jgi:hypothetical protein
VDEVQPDAYFKIDTSDNPELARQIIIGTIKKGESHM